MKKIITLAITLFLGCSVFAEEPEKESGIDFTTGGDLVSSYVWRGVKFGNGPAIQPYVEMNAGNFTLGTWGSVNLTDNEAAEADLYASYTFDFGLNVGLTDYYYPGTDYFNYSSTSGSHGFELNLGYEHSGLNISANYMLNEAPAAGTAGGDMYFQLGYGFDQFGIFAGAGDGWHTSDGNFNVSNIGINVSREITITDQFSLPVSGSAILNPDTEQYYLVLGISL